MEVGRVIIFAKTIQELLTNTFETLGVKSYFYNHIESFQPIRTKHGINRFITLSSDPKLPLQEINALREKHGLVPVETATNIKDSASNRALFARGHPIWNVDFLTPEYFVSDNYTAFTRDVVEVVGHGLMVPLYGPTNRKGVAITHFNRKKDEFEPILTWQISSLMQMMHVRYCNMRKSLQKKVRLTEREHEVLELMSGGKTNLEIAVILGITANTVAGYVQKIFLKLETNDRVSASIKALSLELTL